MGTSSSILVDNQLPTLEGKLFEELFGVFCAFTVAELCLIEITFPVPALTSVFEDF